MQDMYKEESDDIKKITPQGTLGEVQSYVDEEGYFHIKCIACDNMMPYAPDSFHQYLKESEIGAPSEINEAFIARLEQEGCMSCGVSREDIKIILK